jgi:tRNA-specific 2-thiouridylase
VGQRKGLGISSKEPLYVLAIDAKNNNIIVGEKQQLQKKGLIANEFNFLTDYLPKIAKAKIRYAHKEAECKIEKVGEKIKIIFSQKQEAITPGQAVVLYDQDIVLGGGTIEEVYGGDN